MLRSMASYRTLAAAAGISMLAACADTAPPPQPVHAASTQEKAHTALADGPQLAGAWYQVFFDSNSTAINDRGRMIVQTIANVVKYDDLVRVTIIGKTDSVGSPGANSRLSQLRADHVRDALIALAVPSSRIDTTWAGERKQDRATANNVAEQSNRVVDIAVQRPE